MAFASRGWLLFLALNAGDSVEEHPFACILLLVRKEPAVPWMSLAVLLFMYV